MSTSPKHTPGEWFADFKRGWIYSRPKPLTQFVIATMESGSDDDLRVLAAASDLLEALRALELAVLHNGDWDDGCFYHNGTSATELQGPLDAARAALAKAHGLTPEAAE